MVRNRSRHFVLEVEGLLLQPGQAPVDTIQTPVNAIQATVHDIHTPVDAIQAPVNAIKPVGDALTEVQDQCSEVVFAHVRIIPCGCDVPSRCPQGWAPLDDASLNATSEQSSDHCLVEDSQ